MTWVLVFSLFFFSLKFFLFNLRPREAWPAEQAYFWMDQASRPKSTSSLFCSDFFVLFFFPLACLEFSFVVSPSFLKIFSLTLSSLSSSFFMSFYYYYLLFLIILLKLMQRIWLNQVYDPWRGFFPLLYNTPAFNKHHFLVLNFFFI